MQVFTGVQPMSVPDDSPECVKRVLSKCFILVCLYLFKGLLEGSGTTSGLRADLRGAVEGLRKKGDPLVPTSKK